MKEYFVCQPSSEGNIIEEWTQCLIRIKGTQMAGYRPVKLNIFICFTDNSEYTSIRREIIKSVTETFDKLAPAVSITAHPPEKPWKVIVEALFLVPGPFNTETKFYDSIPYVVISHDWGKEVWGAGLGSGFFSEDTRKGSEYAFDQAVDLLKKEDMTLNNIVRQWNYIGNILTIRDGYQNYQVFNEVRSEYYNRYRSVIGYPAATGIGLKSDSVIIDFCAVKPDESVKIKGLSNPNQINAYEYGQKVLKGLKDTGKPKKQPPQFERALIMAFDKHAMLHISGTASIRGQATIGIDDVGKQTSVTIENIIKLTDDELVSQAVPQGVQYSLRFILLRVYIKHQNDFKTVRAVCDEHFPDTPTVFIESDICRDDLLTEIEAEVQIQY
jgi:hypothetical protein